MYMNTSYKQLYMSIYLLYTGKNYILARVSYKYFMRGHVLHTVIGLKSNSFIATAM